MKKHSKEIYTRENLLKLLRKSFGPYKVDGQSVKFDNFDNKEIAEAIGIAEAQFSRRLNPSAGDDSSYRIVVTRALIYQDAKAYRDLKVYQKYFYWLVVPILLFGFLLGYFIKQPVVNDPELKVSSEMKGIYSSPSPKLDDITDASGRATLHRLKWETILINEQVKKRSDVMTKRDSIQAASEMQTAVEKAIREEREFIKKLNFRFPSGKLYMDLVENTMSSHIDSLFKVKEDEIIYIKDADQLPPQATRFDLALMESLTYILSSKYSYREVADKVGNIVSTEQEYLTYGINKLAEPEMETHK